MTLLSNYQTRGVLWTRFRDRTKSPPRTDMKLMRKYYVHIDGGYVGDVLAEDKQHARERAIAYFNIVSNQQVMLTWDHEDEG